jgi:hypothetical protein
MLFDTKWVALAGTGFGASRRTTRRWAWVTTAATAVMAQTRRSDIRQG